MYEITDVITAASANGGRDLTEDEVALASNILPNLRTLPERDGEQRPELSPAQLASLVKGMSARGFATVEEAMEASGTRPTQYLFNVVNWMRNSLRAESSGQMVDQPVTEPQFDLLTALRTIAEQQDRDKVVAFLDRVLEGCVDPDLAGLVDHWVDRNKASKAIDYAKKSLGLDRVSNATVFGMVGIEVTEEESTIADAVTPPPVDDEF